MASYQLTTTAAIIRTADGAFIPADPANTDYAAYLAWVADGNTADPAPRRLDTTDQLFTDDPWNF